MGILVIGDDYEDQLDKFQRSEHARPENRHWVMCDVLVTFRKSYEDRLPNDVYRNENFVDWVSKSFGIGILEEHQEPDLVSKHCNGWIRRNGNGEILELIYRGMPENMFDYFLGSANVFPLKKDRSEAIAAARESARLHREYLIRTKSGFPWEREPLEIDADDFTFTSSAALRDIDFDAMRLAIRVAAEERWDYVASACGSQPWIPFDLIWGKYHSEKYSSENYAAACEEWCDQEAVKAIRHAMKTDPFQSKSFNTSKLQQEVFWSSSLDETHVTIDRFRLDKETYAGSFGLNSVFRYSEVIMNGEQLKDVNLEFLFETIPEESILTDASVHC